MFPREQFLLIAFVASASLVFFSGCKGSEKPAEHPASAGSVVQTAPPAPAVVRTNRVQLPPDSGDNMASNILVWDATEKTYHVQAGELNAPFTFNLTNVSSGPLMIYDTSTTCDCTVASLPSKPWALPSGGAGQLNATMNLRNKTGTVTNQIIVFTSKGNRRLTVKAIVP